MDRIGYLWFVHAVFFLVMSIVCSTRDIRPIYPNNFLYVHCFSALTLSLFLSRLRAVSLSLSHTQTHINKQICQFLQPAS